MSEQTLRPAASGQSLAQGPDVIEETPVALVSAVPFMRIRSTQASASPEEEPPVRRAIRAGLLDAGVRGQPVAALWTRALPWQPLQVMISGPRLADDTPDRPDRGTPLL